MLTIEYRNTAITPADTIRINIANMAQKNYRWIFTITNVDEPARVGVLIDQYLGTETVLNLNGVNSMDFNVTATAASFAPNRFIIVLRQLSVLALKKLIVTAKRNTDGKVVLSWKAINELNMLHYQSEKSDNGISFAAFGKATAATDNNGGNPIYSTQDISNYNSLQYYRIKAVSENLPVQYSEVVKVLAVEKKGNISIYPNPVKGKIIHIVFTDMPKENYAYTIIDNSGRLIANGALNVQTNMTQKNILLNQNLAISNCLLILVNEQGIKTTIAINIAE